MRLNLALIAVCTVVIVLGTWLLDSSLFASARVDAVIVAIALVVAVLIVALFNLTSGPPHITRTYHK